MALRLLGYVRKQETALAGARGVRVIGSNHALIQKIPIASRGGRGGGGGGSYQNF